MERFNIQIKPAVYSSTHTGAWPTVGGTMYLLNKRKKKKDERNGIRNYLLEGPWMRSVQAPYPRIGSHQNSPARLVSLDSRLGPPRGPSSSLDLSALTQPRRVSPFWLSFSYTYRPSLQIDLDQPAVSTQHKAALYRNTQFHTASWPWFPVW